MDYQDIFFCFVCQEKFNTLDRLFTHLKCIHILSHSSTYECGFFDCKQTFTSFRSFSKHMRIKLKKMESNKVTENETKNAKQSLTNIEFREDSESTHRISTVSKPHQNLEVQNSSTENNPDSIDINDIRNSIIIFTCKYFSKFNLPRKDVIKMQKDISHITSSIATSIERCLSKKVNLVQEHQLNELLQLCKNPFLTINSEYKFLKYLEENDFYKKPKVIYLDNTISEVIKNNVNTIDESKTKGIILPLKFLFRKYFEIPGILNSFLENIDSLNTSDDLNNFIKGKLLKSKQYFNKEKLIIPFFLYFDDFEINNPLGSHSSSLLGIYCSFPTAPSHLISKLNNIFVVGFIKTADVKRIGNDKCFYNLVHEIEELELNGVNIKTNEGYKKVYFVLGLILGDNLALNNILGFSKSFSSNYFCRFCRSDKATTQKLCSEKERIILRTKENYSSDVKNNENNYGVFEDSIFNSLKSFHVTENYAVDVMHDIYEGVCIYDMCHIILNCIKKKYFSLEFLNNRKRSFNYGESEIGNMSPSITFQQLSKFNLKMSAREMMTFIHFFPLFVGDVVPVGCQIWSFFLNLLKMIDFILLPAINSEELNQLEKCIKLHNKLYVELFNDNLKPKHHFLIHYCNIIRYSGPLKYLWTFNFESKHKIFKTYIRNITSRINVPYTLSIKYSMHFASNILTFDNKIWSFSDRKKTPLESCEHFGKIQNIKSEYFYSSNSFCIDSIFYCGTKYKKNYVLFWKRNKMFVYKLLDIIIKDEEIYFLCQEISIICYDKHFASYEIGTDTKNFIIENIKNVKNPPTHVYESGKGNKFVRPKMFF